MKVTLPFRSFTESEAMALFMATKEQRYKILEPLFEDWGISLDDVPEVWNTGPLRAWTWLVLTINEIEFDPEVHQSLASFGIDVGFWGGEGINRFIGVIA